MPWATLGKVWVALLVLGLVGGLIFAIVLAMGLGRGTGAALSSGAVHFGSTIPASAGAVP